MDIFAPYYYKDFKCLKDKCEHNCCIGWEIDIDEETLNFYKTKEDIIKNISIDVTAHFILKDDRCPFLNQSGLCNIIINHGEDKLCQICKDHPRFINEFDTRTEIGLGLACEGAAKLILDNDFSLSLLTMDDENEFKNIEEAQFLKERDQIFQSDFDSLTQFLPHIKTSRLTEFLFSLERLDNGWDEYLSNLKNNIKNISETQISDKAKAKRLLDYFIFRYYHEYSLPFCLLCTYIIFDVGGEIYDAARMFSSEIEYSDENMDKLFEFIS